MDYYNRSSTAPEDSREMDLLRGEGHGQAINDVYQIPFDAQTCFAILSHGHALGPAGTRVMLWQLRPGAHQRRCRDPPGGGEPGSLAQAADFRTADHHGHGEDREC